MKKLGLTLLAAVAGWAPSGWAAVNTSIAWQLSTDGFNWTSTMGGVPGGTYYARAVVSYTGTASPLGLASLVFQPTISNWTPADTLHAFVNGGQGGNTSTPPGVVTDPNSVTSFGRLSPWGRSALSATSFLRGHTHTSGSGGAPAGNWLRIAQNHVTSWIGGTGNTSGGGGVPISQLNDVGRTSSDPAFNGSVQNIVVFKYAFTLSSNVGNFVWVIDSPISGMGNYNAATGEREVYWYGSMAETTGSIRGTATVSSATIFVPTPSATLGLLVGAGVLGSRRLRR